LFSTLDRQKKEKKEKKGDPGHDPQENNDSDLNHSSRASKQPFPTKKIRLRIPRSERSPPGQETSKNPPRGKSPERPPGPRPQRPRAYPIDPQALREFSWIKIRNRAIIAIDQQPIDYPRRLFLKSRSKALNKSKTKTFSGGGLSCHTFSQIC